MNTKRQSLAKKVILVFEGVAKKGLIIEPGQNYYRIHVNTHKIEEIELPYSTTVVEFDMEWHYLPALSSEKAFEKFEKYQKNEAAKQSRFNKAN